MVEVEPASDHFRGWLLDSTGYECGFEGWLEFASAVTAATTLDAQESGSHVITKGACDV